MREAVFCNAETAVDAKLNASKPATPTAICPPSLLFREATVRPWDIGRDGTEKKWFETRRNGIAWTMHWCARVIETESNWNPRE